MADKSINKVCVIGAGIMGAGIAAQVANAGVPVLLLDIVRDEDNRNSIAEGAVAKMLKTDPAPFMGKRAAKLVETGNIDDHLDSVLVSEFFRCGMRSTPIRSTNPKMPVLGTPMGRPPISSASSTLMP